MIDQNTMNEIDELRYKLARYRGLVDDQQVLLPGRYRCRNGFEAVVESFVIDNPRPLVGYVVIYDVKITHSWFEDGRERRGEEMGYDLTEKLDD